MAGELVGFTTDGPVSIPSVENRPSLLGTDSRYRGYAAQAVSRSIEYPLDPFAATRDAARKRDTLLRRKILAEQKANAEKAKEYSLFGAPIKWGPANTAIAAVGQAAGAVGEFLTSPAPNFDIKTDVVGNPIAPRPTYQSATEDRPPTPYEISKMPMSMLDPNAEVIPAGGVPATPSGPMSPNAIDQGVPGWRPTSAMSPDAAARATGENLTNLLAANVLSDPNIRNEFRRVQEQVYGTPEIIDLPDGTQRAFYNTDMVMFHGITEDMQAGGFIPGRLPNPLKKDATDKEKYEYYKAAKTGMFVAPRFKLGDEYTTLATMTRDEKVKLQKQMKRAGYYEKGETIIPGIFQANDILYLQQAMGEANVTGLDLPDVFKARAITVAQMKKEGYGGGGGSGAPTRTVDITYNTTSMAQGRAMLARVLEDALGRRPTDSELAQFMAELNDAESKSPTKTITRYINAGKTRTSISRQTPSGVDPQAMAEEFAQGIGGGKPYEANMRDRYIGALLKSLGGFSV